ncbi:MAG: hypothetical protein KC561_16000 [Myxococcales bacterium]|nr:hypothetical protein [Myxococcales bacterium]
MSQNYRVKVFLCGVAKDRASELRSTLKIYKPKEGNEYFKDVLRRAHSGERVLIYESNSDVDAMRLAHAMLRSGAQIEVDGLAGDDPLIPD